MKPPSRHRSASNRDAGPPITPRRGCGTTASSTGRHPPGHWAWAVGGGDERPGRRKTKFGISGCVRPWASCLGISLEDDLAEMRAPMRQHPSSHAGQPRAGWPEHNHIPHCCWKRLAPERRSSRPSRPRQSTRQAGCSRRQEMLSRFPGRPACYIAGRRLRHQKGRTRQRWCPTWNYVATECHASRRTAAGDRRSPTGFLPRFPR